jgi:hypothetical protein
MGFTGRNDDEFTGLRGARFLARKRHLAPAVRDQVVDHDMLGSRHVLDTHFDSRGLSDAPWLGKLRVHEHGAGELHDSKHVGERVQKELLGKSGASRKDSAYRHGQAPAPLRYYWIRRS